jgi:hypothetical protein
MCHSGTCALATDSAVELLTSSSRRAPLLQNDASK